MVYDKDMCKSKLGILMCAFRADRPSEWQMDEFIHHAEDMNKKINELTKQRDELLDAICGLIDFIEIDEIRIDPLALSIAREAISKAKGCAA